MAVKMDMVLALVKYRLNRLPDDTSLDAYLDARIRAADAEAAREGIRLSTERMDDQVYLADMVVWQYQNRDSMAGMPEWLRLKRRELFLKKRRDGT